MRLCSAVVHGWRTRQLQGRFGIDGLAFHVDIIAESLGGISIL